MGRRSPRRAAAAVELAVLLPFLAVSFSGVVDFARVLHTTQLLQAAAQAGAASASGTAWTPGYPGTATTAAKAAAKTATAGLSPALIDEQITVTVANGKATVTVSYDYPLATAVLAASRTAHLTRTVTVIVAPRAGD